MAGILLNNITRMTAGEINESYDLLYVSKSSSNEDKSLTISALSSFIISKLPSNNYVVVNDFLSNSIKFDGMTTVFVKSSDYTSKINGLDLDIVNINNRIDELVAGGGSGSLDGYVTQISLDSQLSQLTDQLMLVISSNNTTFSTAVRGILTSDGIKSVQDINTGLLLTNYVPFSTYNVKIGELEQAIGNIDTSIYVTINTVNSLIDSAMATALASYGTITSNDSRYLKLTDVKTDLSQFTDTTNKYALKSDIITNIANLDGYDGPYLSVDCQNLTYYYTKSQVDSLIQNIGSGGGGGGTESSSSVTKLSQLVNDTRIVEPEIDANNNDLIKYVANTQLASYLYNSVNTEVLLQNSLIDNSLTGNGSVTNSGGVINQVSDVQWIDINNGSISLTYSCSGGCTFDFKLYHELPDITGTELTSWDWDIINFTSGVNTNSIRLHCEEVDGSIGTTFKLQNIFNNGSEDLSNLTFDTAYKLSFMFVRTTVDDVNYLYLYVYVNGTKLANVIELLDDFELNSISVSKPTGLSYISSVYVNNIRVSNIPLYMQNSLPLDTITTTDNYVIYKSGTWTPVTIDSIIGNKVDKITGMGLSTNDFSNSYRDKVDAAVGSMIRIGTISVSSPIASQLTARSTELKGGVALGYVLVDNDNIEWYYDGSTWNNFGQNVISNGNITTAGLVKLGSTTLGTGSDTAATELAVSDRFDTLITDQNLVVASQLATVATSGSYTDLTNKPTIQIGNGSVSTEGGTVTINYSTHQSYNLNLLNSGTIVISNLTAGYKIMVRVDNSSGKTLTFNSVQILDSTDVGIYFIEFINITGTVECIGISPKLA